MYTLHLPDFNARLEMQTKYQLLDKDYGHVKYTYQFYVNDEMLIESYVGTIYHDVFETLLLCLSGVVITPDSGVEDDYFEDYSDKAIEWRDGWDCEQLAGIPYDFESRNTEYYEVTQVDNEYTVKYKEQS